jgi:hypothetical protein
MRYKRESSTGRTTVDVVVLVRVVVSTDVAGGRVLVLAAVV